MEEKMVSLHDLLDQSIAEVLRSVDEAVNGKRFSDPQEKKLRLAAYVAMQLSVRLKDGRSVMKVFDAIKDDVVTDEFAKLELDGPYTCDIRCKIDDGILNNTDLWVDDYLKRYFSDNFATLWFSGPQVSHDNVVSAIRDRTVSRLKQIVHHFGGWYDDCCIDAAKNALQELAVLGKKEDDE